MLRSLISLVLLLAAVALHSQAIDAPVATVRLTRQEVISQRSLRTDFERLEAVARRRLNTEERRQVLEMRINNALFFQFCERERITATEVEITAQINNMRSQLGTSATDANLEQLLRTRGVTLDLRVWARQQVLLQKYIQSRQAERLRAIPQPTADDIIKEYEFNKREFFLPEMARVSMIFVDLRDKGPEDRKRALETLNGLSVQIRASPDRFGEFVTRAMAGNMPYRASTQFMIPKTADAVRAFGQRFVDTAFDTKVGRTSDPVEGAGTQLTGLAIIRVEDQTPERFLGLADLIPGQNRTVQQFIQARLGMERLQNTLDQIEHELLRQLRAEATI
ncbi:MAG TPA: peptidylprolyl isomerase, partial [Magnetospirillaceae bacterium]|nr:peptidylprolyl isomerase [Magnetospirillaceae bacterium]